MAEAKPEVVGDMLVVPIGWTVHKVIPTTHQIAAPPMPEPEIEQRQIGGQAFGRERNLEVSTPVNQHERRWREVLDASCFIFQKHGFSSANLCGKGRPFASATHWKEVTDRLADNGVILKEHGQETLPVGEWANIRARIQDATRPLRLPEYLPPPLAAI